ncbi:MAG: vitamin K epoxide reductase family protein [Thermoplasmata archaeon]|nr:vitamin K epoxide reductase family protein [Thermoplasmata archaeon]MCI4359550.1 vitamin K epoxide reductase family protein [Thermoplasmata archaeon]
MRAESLHAIILLASIVGVGLSVFAYAESVDPALQHDCSVNAFFSCAKVDQSGQTTTLGIPDWAIGTGGFLFLLAIDIPLYASWRPVLLQTLTAASAVGVGVSAYLAYIELFRIQALCPVCLSAYLANGLVFASALMLIWKGRMPVLVGHTGGDGTPSSATDLKST